MESGAERKGHYRVESSVHLRSTQKHHLSEMGKLHVRGKRSACVWMGVRPEESGVAEDVLVQYETGGCTE